MHLYIYLEAVGAVSEDEFPLRRRRRLRREREGVDRGVGGLGRGRGLLRLGGGDVLGPERLQSMRGNQC